MGIPTDFAHDVLSGNSAGEQRIGNQGTVASPRNGFRAHQCDAILVRELNKAIESLFEFRGLHVVGKAAEGCILPCRVNRISLWPPQSAESSQVKVSDTGRLERRRQCLTIELRIVPRAGHSPDVHDAGYTVRF